MTLVSSAMVAEALGVSTRRVEQLVHEGMPREGRGQYELQKCLLWYVRYAHAALQARGSMDGDGDVVSAKDERARLLRVQREREELALAKDRGLVMALQDHEEILSRLILETKARIMAVGPRIAGDLVGEDSRTMIQAKLEKAHREALKELSRIEPRMPPVAEPESDVEQAPEPVAEAAPPKVKKPARRRAKRA